MTASTRSKFALSGALAIAVGCGSDPKSTFPSYHASTTSTGTTTSSSASGGGGSSSSGAGGSGGGGIDAGSGGSGDSGSDDGGTVNGARCQPDFLWSTLGRIDSIPADNFARFGGISADELSVAWTVASGDVYVADRTKLTASFGTPMKVNGADAVSIDRVALSPTGTNLVAVRADRGGFLGFERASSSDPWMPSSGLEFTQVRVVFEAGSKASDPVLGGDKKSFFFVLAPQNRSPVLYESHWDGVAGSWGLPSALSNVEFESIDGAHRRTPTGSSTDGRTLFFFDDVAGLERAAWRESPAVPFALFRDVGPFPEAAPSARCDSLYYRGQDAAGTGVFSAE